MKVIRNYSNRNIEFDISGFILRVGIFSWPWINISEYRTVIGGVLETTGFLRWFLFFGSKEWKAYQVLHLRLLFFAVAVAIPMPLWVRFEQKFN